MPFVHRPEYEAHGMGLARQLTGVELERAKLEYREWFRDKFCTFASAMYHSEMETAKQKAFFRAVDRGLRSSAAPLGRSGVNGERGEDDGCGALAVGALRPGAKPIDTKEWRQLGFGAESVPDEFALAVASKATGKRRGRPPLNGGRAMTGTERSRLHRQKVSNRKVSEHDTRAADRQQRERRSRPVSRDRARAIAAAA
jgi:hypothetical protein